MPEGLETEFVGSLAWIERESSLLDLGEKFGALCSEMSANGAFYLGSDEDANRAMAAFEAHLQNGAFQDTPGTLSEAIFAELAKNRKVDFWADDVTVFAEFVEICRAQYNGENLEDRAWFMDNQRNDL